MRTITAAAFATMSDKTALCSWPQAALYRARAVDGSLLYVGVSRHLIRRWQTHARKAAWWPFVSRLDYLVYPNENAALDAERHAIRDEQPLYNKRSAGRAGRCEVNCAICSAQQAVHG